MFKVNKKKVIPNFEHISDHFLLFLLLTLSKQMLAGILIGHTTCVDLISLGNTVKTVQVCLSKFFFLKNLKIHRKTPALESLF